MPKPSKVELMPSEVREWLDKALIDRSFSGYKELEALMKDRGVEISHAAIHRHGQKLERSLRAIKIGTEMAQVIVESSPDKADSRNAATIALLQTSIFNVLVDLQEAEETDDPAKKLKLLSGAAAAFSMLAKSSLAQKGWEEKVKAKLDAIEKAAQKETGEKKAITLEVLNMIRKEVYGV